MENFFDDVLNDLGIETGADEAFAIDNDHKAEWALRKIREIRSEEARLNGVRRQMIEDYQRAYEAEAERADAKCRRLEGLLQAYFDSVPHRSTKTQEIYQLPSGKLVAKRAPITYDRDDEAIIHWAIEHGYESYVKAEPKLNWAALKRDALVDDPTGDCIIGSTGEIVPGLKANSDGGMVFSVALNKEDQL